ncbi:MAG: hypothetical protein HGA38_02160 [Candidatus Moranbacteria bacterium]|nr:hypothetical protein [Candidatus Moranbacteria bacterium]NTW45698.1 hypothetical protein [Candidatus Moranbacteria bacterium]
MPSVKGKSVLLEELVVDRQAEFEWRIMQKKRSFRTVEHLRRRMEEIRAMRKNLVRATPGSLKRIPFMLALAQVIGVIGTDSIGDDVSEFTDRVFGEMVTVFGEKYFGSVERGVFAPLLNYYASTWQSVGRMADPRFEVRRIAGSGPSALQKIFLLSDAMSFEREGAVFVDDVVSILGEHEICGARDPASLALFASNFFEVFVKFPVKKLTHHFEPGFASELQVYEKRLGRRVLSLQERSEGSVILLR